MSSRGTNAGFTGQAGRVGLRQSVAEVESKPASMTSSHGVDHRAMGDGLSVAAVNAAVVASQLPSAADSRLPSGLAAIAVTTAAVASTEMPAAMEDDVLSWMFSEWCPGMQYTTAADLPSTVAFLLMYVDPENSEFFWAAMMYGNKVHCLLLHACFSVPSY